MPRTLNKIINPKDVLLFIISVSFIILFASSTLALAPLCNYADGAKFDGTWHYNDEGTGNDFAVTCRNGRLTGVCAADWLPRGANKGIYVCEGSYESSCKYAAQGGAYPDFSGTWTYHDQGSGNDWAVVCNNGKFDTFLTYEAFSRGSHSGDVRLGTFSSEDACKTTNGNNFDGTWEFNDEGSGNDFAVVCKSGVLNAFCVNEELVRGTHPGVYACGGENKYKGICFNDGDCNDNNLRTQDVCLNPGTIQSSCQHNAVKCIEDSDCNDNNVRTEDRCVNPGVGSYCSNKPVFCLSNTECGASGFAGDNFCSNNNVFGNFVVPVCVNAGTADSYCSSTTSVKMASDCGVSSCSGFGAGYCKNGNVYHSRICDDRGCSNGNCFDNQRTEEELAKTCVSGCDKGGCLTITCSNDSQCNDNNASTEDRCVNPGVGSYCSNKPITCFCNNDCGTNSFVDGNICQNNNVFGNFVSYTCLNPGTSASYCSNSSALQLVKNCLSNQVCSNGSCVDVNIACFNDSQCDDGNQRTKDVCLNPGSVNAVCSHTNLSCLCDSECGKSSSVLVCDGKNVMNLTTNHVCFENSCKTVTESDFIKKCSAGCSNGKCNSTASNNNPNRVNNNNSDDSSDIGLLQTVSYTGYTAYVVPESGFSSLSLNQNESVVKLNTAPVTGSVSIMSNTVWMVVFVVLILVVIVLLILGLISLFRR